MYNIPPLLIVPLDTGVHSEHGRAIRCDIKPGSVERSEDVENEKMRRVYPQAPKFNLRCFIQRFVWSNR
jgi:hypothetical protein